MLWGWHRPCGCKFGRDLGRREVGGCFGLAPPCGCKGGKRRRESAKRVFQYGRYRAARWAALRRKMGEIGTQSRPCCKGCFCGLCAACHAASAELQQSGPPMGGAKLQTVRQGSHRPTACSFFFRTPEKGCICGKITQKGGVFHFPSPRIRTASETKNRVKGRCFCRVLSRVRMRVRVKCGIIAPIERIFQDGRKCSGNPGKRYAFDLDQC